MRINVRRVAWHRGIVEVVPANQDAFTTYPLHEVDRIIVWVGVIPRVTRLGCLLHPPRIIPVHRAYLRAEARLVEDLDHLANLVLVADRETLRTPLVNRERVVRVRSDDRCCSVRWTTNAVSLPPVRGPVLRQIRDCVRIIVRD